MCPSVMKKNHRTIRSYVNICELTMRNKYSLIVKCSQKSCLDILFAAYMPFIKRVQSSVFHPINHFCLQLYCSVDYL